MVIAESLINDSGISSTALTLFAIIIGGLATAGVGIYKVRAEQREAKVAAEEAKDAAIQAAKNTVNVSNGFASSVGGKLDRIVTLTLVNTEKINDIGTGLREHLQWHMDNQTQKKGTE